MNIENLVKANEILEELNNCESNIKKAKYTQCIDVVKRQTYLTINGLDGPIEVPESLFRTIGKLILSEYNQTKIELEKQFKEL